KGSVVSDTRTNTLIVRDVPDNVERITEVVKKLDSKTPQVMIEARIVEAATDFRRELGVQWGGRREVTTSSYSSLVSGLAQTGAGLSGNGLVVNLPASVASGAGGAIGFTIGNLANTWDLDLQLSALEMNGRGKVLSNPRILTLDNKEAKISQGTEILVPTTTIVTGVSTGASTGGTDQPVTSGVTTINAKLELTVTPHITPDGQILMHVVIDKKDPDFARQVQGIPPLDTRSAVTDLLVKDGETIVIGGIYSRRESKRVDAVPWFYQIPFLGWLFKKEIKTDTQLELLIFITPTVYK
ncbi:MAG: type IV pilus secretin PilQ, partial [Nitrospiria bacterium]